MRDNISSKHKRRSNKTIFVPEPLEKSGITPSFTLIEYFCLYFIILWEEFVQFRHKHKQNVMKKVLYLFHFLH